MTHLVYAVRAALVAMRQSPFVHGVAVLTIAVALSVAGLARFAAEALERALEVWGSEVELTLYLNDKVTPEQAEELAVHLRVQEGAQVARVSADEALARLRAELGPAGDVLSNLPKNPLPASLEVRPPQSRRTAADIAAMAEVWRKLPGVDDVDYGREWVERLERLRAAARGAGLALLALVLIAAAVVVAATLQLAIYARRDEIEIQKLVGATNWFVKAPFVIEGVVQGLAGAAIAALALWALARYLGPRASGLFEFVGGEGSGLTMVGVQRLAQLGAAGLTLGLTGSVLAVRRFLRV